MATQTLEDTKTEEEPPVKEKEELKTEESKQENQETDKGEKNQELPGEVVSRDTKELEETVLEDEVHESEEEKEPSDKAKPGREGSSKEDQVESKKESPEKRPGQESTEKKESVTPANERPTRERKSVERYSAPSVVRSSSSKTLSIEKVCGERFGFWRNMLLLSSFVHWELGIWLSWTSLVSQGRGTQLKEIPNGMLN